MALNDIAKQAVESLSAGTESTSGTHKFEMPGTQDVTDATATRPEGFDAQEIKDKLGNVPTEAESTKQIDQVEKGSEPAEELEKQGLTEDEKIKLKEETGWVDEIIDSIDSIKEADVYKKADLQETTVGEKKCLVRTDIDINQADEFGRSNKERMENGQPPLTKQGDTVELHHIGQKQDSPLAELTTKEHRGKGNYAILHDTQKESEIDRTEFGKERETHWENRAKLYE